MLTAYDDISHHMTIHKSSNKLRTCASYVSMMMNNFQGMDFSSVQAEAVDYLNKSNCGLSISKIDEESHQIHLSSTDGIINFYISCPSLDNVSWNIWSDSIDSQQVLQYVMDSCNLDASSSISSILESVTKLFMTESRLNIKQPGATKDEESGDDATEDDADDDDSYYVDEDIDALVDEEMKKVKEQTEENKLAANFFNHSGSEVAVKRLIKDMKALCSNDNTFGISAAPINNNLFVWAVKFSDLPEDCKLGRDLTSYATKYKTEPVIHLNMQFPEDYPFSPPFIRVLKPRFQFMTGYVTIGGSICMQMLTKSGWQPTNDIESILVQVRAQILSDPDAALDMTTDQEYTESDAKLAFQRMVQRYGW